MISTPDPATMTAEERGLEVAALTKQITGSHMNGFRFFRLGVQR